MSLLVLLAVLNTSFSLTCSSLPSKTVQFDFYSGVEDWAVGNLYPNGNYAVPVQNSLAFDTLVSSGSLMIWESYMPYDSVNSINCTFSRMFYVPGTIISATLVYRADNYGSVKINGVDAGCSSSNNAVKTCNVKPQVISGTNSIYFNVMNQGSGTYDLGNLAGLSYYLSVMTSVLSY